MATHKPQHKFKLGDRVVIAQRTTTSIGPVCTPEMVKLAERNKVHIVAPLPNGAYDEWVKLEGYVYYWHPDWLKHAEDYDSL